MPVKKPAPKKKASTMVKATKSTKLVKPPKAAAKHIPKAKTVTEVEAEVKALVAVKAKVPRRTMFGDNNHDAINAQIEVLEEDLNDEEIANRFLPTSPDGEPDETDIDEGRSIEVESAAREALNWREDEKGAEQPSASWETLVANVAKCQRN